MLMEFCLLFSTQAFFEREGLSDIYIKRDIEQKSIAVSGSLKRW